jgi:hypothetical protein
MSTRELMAEEQAGKGPRLSLPVFCTGFEPDVLRK